MGKINRVIKAARKKVKSDDLEGASIKLKELLVVERGLMKSVKTELWKELEDHMGNVEDNLVKAYTHTQKPTNKKLVDYYLEGAQEALLEFKKSLKRFVKVIVKLE